MREPYPASFRDGPKEQTRNLDVVKVSASQSRDSGFARFTRAPE